MFMLFILIELHFLFQVIYNEFYRGVPRIWRGGGKNFFSDLEIWMCKVMRFARGVWGHGPPKKFFKWCNLVRFGVDFVFKKL